MGPSVFYRVKLSDQLLLQSGIVTTLVCTGRLGSPTRGIKPRSLGFNGRKPQGLQRLGNVIHSRLHVSANMGMGGDVKEVQIHAL
jgi:hypothetical protein